MIDSDEDSKNSEMSDDKTQSGDWKTKADSDLGYNPEDYSDIDST